MEVHKYLNNHMRRSSFRNPAIKSQDSRQFMRFDYGKTFNILLMYMLRLITRIRRSFSGKYTYIIHERI